MNTVLIVEDEEAILELVAFSCRSSGFAVQKAVSVADARDIVAENPPDIIVLDWMLPDCPGLEWLLQLRADPETESLPVVMLTARAAEGDRISGLEAGADDYVVKPFSPRELVARLKAVLRRRDSGTREKRSENDVVACGCLTIDEPKFEVRVDGKEVKLGVIEFRLLHLMASNPGRVYSREQLISRVWGEDGAMSIDERTVDVHILRLRRVLSSTAAKTMVETVRGLGYRVNTAS